MISSANYLGGFLALFSAFLWAAASLIWNQLNKQNISPIAISLGKTIIACCYFAATALFIGYNFPGSKNFLMLSLSGFLGISIGDTAFFYSLKYLGPRRSVLLTVFIPVTTVLLAFLFLHERLSFLKWLGIFICICGTIIVIQERTPDGAFINKKRGIIWAVISIISCATSILISKVALSTTGAFEASLIRLGAGGIGLFLYCVVKKGCFKGMSSLWKPKPLKLLLLSSFFGTFLGIWCFIEALKYTLASIVIVLNGISPIFILPLSYWFLREKISKRAVLGTVIAVLAGTLVIIF
ncbi:MAG: DMT family transporter [Candidatus Omnitrophota bacterium]|jgi:drug/metabolite transporter (DMT)-like permease